MSVQSNDFPSDMSPEDEAEIEAYRAQRTREYHASLDRLSEAEIVAMLTTAIDNGNLFETLITKCAPKVDNGPF